MIEYFGFSVRDPAQTAEHLCNNDYITNISTCNHRVLISFCETTVFSDCREKWRDKANAAFFCV